MTLIYWFYLNKCEDFCVGMLKKFKLSVFFQLSPSREMFTYTNVIVTHDWTSIALRVHAIFSEIKNHIVLKSLYESILTLIILLSRTLYNCSFTEDLKLSRYYRTIFEIQKQFEILRNFNGNF